MAVIFKSASPTGGGSGGGGGGGGGGLLSTILGGAGSLLGGIGKMFGFADGGFPPVGQPYIVGERGPEIRVDRNPGAIIPMNGMGGSVTYNINAVDAQSFKSMIAADPAFLYGVAMQGAKGIPMRS
jgi:hypothetical protein